jgi:quinoprotein glucose dehydrogenase
MRPIRQRTVSRVGTGTARVAALVLCLLWPAGIADGPSLQAAPQEGAWGEPVEGTQLRVSESDLIDYTPELKAEALKIVSEYKIGPLYTPPTLLADPEGPKGLILVPGTNGGANWGGAAFDKETGILYVPSARLPNVIALGKSQHPESTLPYVRQSVPGLPGPQGLPTPFKPPYPRLTAINLHPGDILWAVANGDGLRDHPAFAGLDVPPTGKPGRISAIVTKTLVFMGEGSDSGVGLPPAGGGGNMFRAFDKTSGRIVWEMELPAGTSGSPMTYMAGGKHARHIRSRRDEASLVVQHEAVPISERGAVPM